jgi:hypothetical protein
MSSLVTLARACRDTLAGIAQSWSRFWFEDIPTTPLELARMGIGAALLLHYGLATPYLFDLWGDAGWLPLDVLFKNRTDPFLQSIFFYFTAPWQLVAFHALFLLCCFAFMVGWRTSWVKWVVLIGQISYDYRNPMLPYGVDKIAACLLFILCIAPVGRALSLDRVRALRMAKLKSLEAVLPRYTSPWAGARLG